MVDYKGGDESGAWPRARDATLISSPLSTTTSRRLVLCQTSVCTPSVIPVPGIEAATRATPPDNNISPPPPPPPLLPTLHPARTRAYPCPCAPLSTPPPPPQPRLHPPRPFRLQGGTTKDGGETSMVMGSLRKRRRCSARVNAILVSCMMMTRRKRKRVGRPVLRGYTMQLRRCVRVWPFRSFLMTSRNCGFSDRRRGEDQRTNRGLCLYDHQVRR